MKKDIYFKIPINRSNWMSKELLKDINLDVTPVIMEIADRVVQEMQDNFIQEVQNIDKTITEIQLNICSWNVTGVRDETASEFTNRQRYIALDEKYKEWRA